MPQVAGTHFNDELMGFSEARVYCLCWRRMRMRIQVAKRIIELQPSLSDQIAELEDALAHVRTLRGILPIRMYLP